MSDELRAKIAALVADYDYPDECGNAPEIEHTAEFIADRIMALVAEAIEKAIEDDRLDADLHN